MKKSKDLSQNIAVRINLSPKSGLPASYLGIFRQNHDSFIGMCNNLAIGKRHLNS